MFKFHKILLFIFLLLFIICMIIALIIFVLRFYSISPLSAQQNNEFTNNNKSNTIYDIVYQKNLSHEFIEQLSYVKDRKVLQHITAIILGYPNIIKEYYWDFNSSDFVFHINDKKIYYADGKMLFHSNLKNKDLYHTIMYPYLLDPIYDVYDSIFNANKNLHVVIRATDFQNAITRNQVPSQLKSVYFLGNKITVHLLIADILSSIEKQILELAKNNIEVSDFLNDIYQVSSYSNRKVQKSENISMHSFGLALDFLHINYDRKAVYWQWSKVIYPNKWNKLSLENLWLIPKEIVSVFENHGFVWGGKWKKYDTIHFEYRPEIIEYAKIIQILDREKN